MSESIKVAVRVRPCIHAYEKVDGVKCIIRMLPETQQTIITHPETGKEKSFTFDYSYNSFVDSSDPNHASQETVWNDLGVDVLENAWKGFNVSLFAYGQTGSGKSHSMMGYPGEEGIVPRACREIFERIRNNEDKETTFKVEASMMEIYNERVRDLFNPTSAGNRGLKVRDNPKTGPYVQGLTKLAVSNYAEISEAMESGTRARTVAATAMNATSSRAHTIFQMILTQTKVDSNLGKATDKVSTISLIDLAGSERANRTGASGDRLKEGCAINQSLSALGNVINSLSESNPRKKVTRIPYRDSVLTHLLKNSLGGNAKTVMIAAISPSDVNYDETVSTLRYADRAKMIKNQAVVNEDANAKMVRGLKDEILALKQRLASNIETMPLENEAAGNLDPAKFEQLRAKWEKEKEMEMARMKEQMLENERLVRESQKSWEQKLSESQTQSENRNQVLSNLGMKVDLEKQKQTPHITNLNQDSQMSGVLTYFFEDGLSRIGRADAAVKQNVVLSGLSIEKEHCTVTNIADKVTLVNFPGAKTYINGHPLDSEGTTVQLHHGDRIIFGNNQVFLFWEPRKLERAYEEERAHIMKANKWDEAMKELNDAKLQQLTESERLAREQAEREAEKMQQKLRALETKIEHERRQAEVAARKASDEEREKMLETQKNLEKALRQQMEDAKREKLIQERKQRLRDVLENQISTMLPLINESNAMSTELEKGKVFSIQLVANHSKAMQSDSGDELANVMETDVWVKVETEEDDVPQLWSHEKFMNRLYLMREMYQDFVEANRNKEDIQYDDSNDPFYDPPDETLIGNAYIMLDTLNYFLDIEDMPPVINYKGKTDGVIQVSIRLDPEEVEKFDDIDAEEETTLKDIIGQTLKFTFTIEGAKGIPRKLFNNVNVSYKFFTFNHRTIPSLNPTINPKFNDKFETCVTITEEFVRYINKDAIEFQVWGTSDKVIENRAKLNSETSQNESKTEEKNEEKNMETKSAEYTSSSNSRKEESEEKESEINSLKEKFQTSEAKLKKLKEESQKSEKKMKQELKQLQEKLTEKHANVELLESKVKALESTLEIEKNKSSTCVLS